MSINYPLIHVGELEDRPIDWLIQDYVEKNVLVEIFGAPATYKSFLTISWACHVASGMEFFGRRVQQGPVVYIAGEGQSGLARRFNAWAVHHKVDLKKIPLYVSKLPASLCDKGELTKVKLSISKIADIEGPPLLIIIDTLARNFGEGDENSTKDMMMFIRACDSLRSHWDTTVLLVHHSGHGDQKRARGALALKAALDAEFKMSTDKGLIYLTCTKMKDSDNPDTIAFTSETVEIGVPDEDGNPVTSIVLKTTDYVPPTKTGKEGQGKWQKVGLATLKELCEKIEVDECSTDGAKVKIEDWRKACYDKEMNPNQFFRIKKSLSENEAIKLDASSVEIRCPM